MEPLYTELKLKKTGSFSAIWICPNCKKENQEKEFYYYRCGDCVHCRFCWKEPLISKMSINTIPREKPEKEEPEIKTIDLMKKEKENLANKIEELILEFEKRFSVTIDSLSVDSDFVQKDLLGNASLLMFNRKVHIKVDL